MNGRGQAVGWRHRTFRLLFEQHCGDAAMHSHARVAGVLAAVYGVQCQGR